MDISPSFFVELDTPLLVIAPCLWAQVQGGTILFVRNTDLGTVVRVIQFVSGGWPIPGWGYLYVLSQIIKRIYLW